MRAVCVLVLAAALLLPACGAVEPLLSGAGAAYSYHKFDTIESRVERLEENPWRR